MAGAGIPRQEYAIWYDAQQAGVLTSRVQSPMLGVGVALGYVPPCARTSGRTSRLRSGPDVFRPQL